MTGEVIPRGTSSHSREEKDAPNPTTAHHGKGIDGMLLWAHIDLSMVRRYGGNKRLVCLVLMPMLKGYEAIRETVSRSVAAAGAHMCRLEDVLPDAEWQHWLAESALRADLALADVTDHNPFVMYELGVAHQEGIPTALMVNSRNERVPATVLGTPFLPYDVRRLSSCARALTDILRDMMQVHRRRSTHPLSTATPSAPPYLCFHRAQALLRSFRAATSCPVTPVSRREFGVRTKVAELRGEAPSHMRNERHLARHLLARIIRDSDDVHTMRAVDHWVRGTFGMAEDRPKRTSDLRA